MYDPDRINYIKEILNGTVSNRTVDSDSDRLAHALWAHYLRTGYLSARILDVLSPSNIGSFDPDVIRSLIESLPAKPFTVISIHDCFRCLPSYGNDLRQQYNLQLSMIAKSTILQSMIGQILGRDDVTIGKLDYDMWKDVLEADYALS